jgi:hypothetical protein
MWTCITQDADVQHAQLPFAGLIHSDGNGYFLICYDGMMEFIGDTWHQNPDDAFEQAWYAYGIEAGAWCEQDHIDDQRDAIEFLRELVNGYPKPGPV